MLIRQHLLALSLFLLPVAFGKQPETTPINQVTFPPPKKATYSYESLVGYGFFPSDGRDKFGDTAGGWGSAIAADLDSWKLNNDGSYEGIIYGVPDRGWNTNGGYLLRSAISNFEGTVDYQTRIHKFKLSLRPYFGDAPVTGHQLVWTYLDSLLLYDNNHAPTTGFVDLNSTF